MKNKKWYVITGITFVCIMINLAGRVIAERNYFPLWFDSIGTFIMAYVGGPVCGAIVGFVTNIIYGIFVDMQTVYALVGAMMGVIAGIAAKKKVFDNPFKVMSLGMCLAILCTIISVILSVAVYDGSIGNIWGDQIVLMFVNSGVPRAIAWVVAQFYLEFLDKFIAVAILFLFVQYGKRFKKMLIKRAQKKDNIVMLAIVVVAGMFLCDMPVHAENIEINNYNEYTQLTYSSPEGLLAGEANDIVQTKDGRIWVGTYAGLYSYDGARFKAYNDFESVKNVNSLYVDEEGRLWVATNDNGFTIIIDGKVMNTMSVDDGLLSNTVKRIVCDSNGKYYIGTADGLCIVELNGGVKIVKIFDGIKNINTLAADKNGTVIAITDDGKYSWFKDCEQVECPIKDLDRYNITSAFFTGDDFLYFGTNNGHVISYKITGGVPYFEKSFLCEGIDIVNSFYENEVGEIFVCADSGVGYFNDNRNFKNLNTNQFSSSIESMLEDYQGDLWFASSRLGLLKLCESSFAEVFAEVGLDSHVTNAAVVWNNRIYCGTDDGLFIIDEANRKVNNNTVSERMNGIRIRGMYVDSNNNLWMTTTGEGVFWFEKQKGNTYIGHQIKEENGLNGNRFRQVTELKNGTIAVSGDQGVAFIKNGKVTDVFDSESGLVNIKSLCMLEVGDKLYVGSDGGGISIIQNGKVVDSVTREDGLSSNVILRMVYDAKSEGIIVVASNGLNYISEDGEIRKLDKFPYSNSFDVIFIDSDTVWVTGSAGIYIADAEKLIANENPDYELLNFKRGLRLSMTANSWNCIDGKSVLLCCDSGLVRTDFSIYDTSSRSYRMVLDYVEADGTRYDISRNEQLTIPSNTTTITFAPEILNYSLNDPYVSYKLEGYDTEEKTMLLSEMDVIPYNNVPSGEYEFVISVWDSKKDNIIETGSYSLIVESEMYQLWWFKLYFITVTALIVIWITWFITRTQMQKQILKQKLELEYTRKQLQMGKETILSIAHTVDAKDSNTSQHSVRVSDYSLAIARRIGMSESDCENLRQMALLHDIGKIGIPDSILNKPGKLTDEEYAVMKTHVTRGAEILKDFTLIRNVNYGVLYHHERYDGKGYSTGLKGEEIPLEARIICLADTFDAMTANRVYRKGLSIDVVTAEIERCKGTQFDPKLADVMLELIKEGAFDEYIGKKEEEDK